MIEETKNIDELADAYYQPLRIRCRHFHAQTLETLNARGGLSPQELWIHVMGLKFAPETWSKIPTLDELRTRLRSLGGE